MLVSIGAILATGLVTHPSMGVRAQMYSNEYGYDNNYYQGDNNRYGYDNDHPKKSSHTDIQKINCGNSNINVNGIDITEIPTDDLATTGAANEGVDAIGTQNGNGLGDRINFGRNLVNVCVNVNDNEQVKVTPPPEEEDERCEECFRNNLDADQIDDLLQSVVEVLGIVSGDITLGDLCTILDLIENGPEETTTLDDLLSAVTQSGSDTDEILTCLADLGLIQFPIPG